MVEAFHEKDEQGMLLEGPFRARDCDYLGFSDYADVLLHQLQHPEDESNYTYFLSNCMRSSAFASTFNSPDMTFFTDGHKGSRPSLVACCPEAQTRRCLQHYIRNAPPPLAR